MDFKQQLERWAKGDTLQGKIMLLTGLLILVALIFILLGNNPMLKGMLIPLGLFTVLNIGYGGFLTFSRPKHMIAAAELYHNNPTEAVKKEYAKAKTDFKTYSVLKPVWGVLIAISIGLFFIFSREYYKGLALGLTGLFFGVLVVDFFLHRRLKPYFNTLKELFNKQDIG